MFNASLFAQLLWFIMATGYNTLSLFALVEGETGFAGDAATTRSAMIVAIAFGAVTLAGFCTWLKIYKTLSPIVVIALFFGGVLRHINAGPAEYASETYWMFAILTNCFGTLAYATGVFATNRNKKVATLVKGHSTCRAGPQEPPLCRVRRWWAQMGCHYLAYRHRKAQ